MFGTRTFGSKPFGSIYAPAQTGNSLFINGVDQSGLLTRETLKIQESVNSRASMGFNLIDILGVYLPVEGQSILYTSAGLPIFRGSIDSVTWYSDITSARFITCACVNMAQVLDRRLVAKTYLNTTTDAIVRDVITNYLAADGIVAGQIDPGLLLTKIVYNYVTASALMDEICNLTGFSWNVDQYGQLNVQNRSSVLAPWNITDISAPVVNFKAMRNRANYYNREWLQAGQDTTDLRTEAFKGDGDTQTFVTQYPVATAPTVTVNAVTKTVGIRQVNTGNDWYWNKNDNTITQDDTATPLASTDVLAVTYTGFFPLIVKVQNDAEIAARALIEGGTGLYENVDSDSSIEDRDLATSKALGLLQKFSAIQEKITYQCYDFGIRAGQLQSITQTVEAVSGEYLISEVSMVWSAMRLGYVVNVTALSGQQLGGWQAFFKALFAATTTDLIRDNDVVALVTSKAETLSFTDIINFVTAISDGSDDPNTTSWVSDATQSAGHQFRVGKARIGRDYFS